MTMRMIDMFAGMGNMRLGFEQAGWKCVYSIEFDKHKREIYKAIYGKEPEGNDITEIRGTDLPRAELWAFGAPCQDFSIAGKRAGLDGDRSGLVREVFRLVREKEPNDRPEWLLYENVKGMLSSNGGWDFAAIQAEMGELGYDVQWQLLNSKNFGVPQNRERVFTIGHLRERGTRKVFPIRENDGIISETEGNRTDFKQYGDGTYIVEPSVIQIGNINPDSDDFKNHSAGRVYSQDGLSPTLNTMQGGQRQPMIITPRAVEGVNRGHKDQNGRRLKEPDESMFTLTKQDIHGVAIIDDTYGYGGTREYTDNAPTLRKGRQGLKIAQTLDTQCNQATLQNTRIRRLTPRECMRLQGVPDSITDKIIQAGISDTQMYRAAGDAVTVNVVQAIAEKIKMNSMK